jgi:Ni/Fe-hydrogenase 1 B-type cytochrome subunit
VEFVVSKYSFRKYQSVGLRLWHWANSVVILGLLGTVLIRKTFLSWRANSVVIQQKMSEAGNPITPKLAKEIAVAIRDPLWDWHVYLGFALGALLLSRILIAVLVEKQCPGFAALKSALGIRNVPAEERFEALHFSAVKIGYAIFYLVTLTMVITGLLLNFETSIGLSEGIAGLVQEIHEFLMWFFVIFIAGHILGVVIAEHRADQGIVSDMIHGGKQK